MSLSATHTGLAQNSSLEFWPETDLWYRLSPSWRLSAFLPLTTNVETKYRELDVYLQADYQWGHTKHEFYARLVDENRAQKMKAWMVRGGFMEGWSFGEQSESYAEAMVFGEIQKRVPLKGEVLLSQRFRTDLRWIGQDPDFSYRLRYRIMVEKEFEVGRRSIVPYFNVEPYWDSRYSTVNRLRIIGGSTVAWSPRLALEGNITYQYDSQSSVTNTYALNIILHLYFETARAKAGSP